MEHTSPAQRAFALVGPGRAGMSVALALRAAGWRATAVAGRAVDAPSVVAGAARLSVGATEVGAVGRDATVLILAVPDAAIAETAVASAPGLAPGSLVIHLSGALGLDVLAALQRLRPDVRVGALHPLVSMPSAELGANRLAGAWCAVAGDDATVELAQAMGAQPFVVAEAARVTYHAAASVAANHVVAVLAQVERLAAAADVPIEAFVPLVQSALDNVADAGAAAALTGPVARGDLDTVVAHLAALPEGEREAYRSLAREALRLTGRDDPLMAAVLRAEVTS